MKKVNPMLDAALAYAARGWPVFPCRPDTKAPLVKGDPDPERPGKTIAGTGGVKKASTDPDVIRAWWMRWPRAMIAVPTGAPIGLVVFDLDVCEDKKTGEVFTLERLLADVEAVLGVALPANTPTSATPRGGRHLFMKPPGGEYPHNRVGDDSIAEHVDVRSTGGYVIVPPSIRDDGKRYEWMLAPEAVDAVEAPIAALDCVERRGRWARESATKERQAPAAPARRTASPPSRGGADDAVRRYALAALDAEARTLAQAAQGSRNHAINVGAFRVGQLVGAKALDRGEAFDALADVVRSWENVDKSVGTIERGLDAGALNPRNLDEVRDSANSRAGRMSAALPPPPEPDYLPPPRTPAAGRPLEGEPIGGLDEGAVPPEPDYSAGAGNGLGDISDADAMAATCTDSDKVDPKVVAEIANEPQNDTGNGKRLLGHFGEQLLFVDKVGWQSWVGSHWEGEGGEYTAQMMAQRTAARIVLEADAMSATPAEARAIEAAESAAEALERLEASREKWNGEDKAKARRLATVVEAGDEARGTLGGRKMSRRKYAISSGNSGKLAGMLEQAKPHKIKRPEDLDADPLQFNVQNGTLKFIRERDDDCPDPGIKRWIARAELRPHKRDDWISKVAPVEYKPGETCPLFLAFLERFQPAESMRQFLQTWMGYCITGLTDEQALVFFHGNGANGKSTFVDTICQLMGTYSRTLSFESLAGEQGKRGDQATPDIARLPGSRLVRASEPERGVAFKESLLKSLTSGENLLARHLNERFFEFKPTFKLVLSGNHKPEIGGVDHGIWRRIKFVPWEVKISDEERRPQAEVIAEFMTEKSGILNWLVEGVLRYLISGLKIPKEVIEATDSYRDDMDPIGGFIADCVTMVPPTPTGVTRESVSARDMYHAFVAWCEANAVRHWKEKAFGLAMPQKGFEKRTLDGRRLYVGARLHDVPAREAGGRGPPPPPDDARDAPFAG